MLTAVSYVVISLVVAIWSTRLSVQVINSSDMSASSEMETTSPKKAENQPSNDSTDRKAVEKVNDVKEKKKKDKNSKDKSPRQKESSDGPTATKQKDQDQVADNYEDSDNVMHVVIGGQKVKIKTKPASPSRSPERQLKTSKSEEPAAKESVAPSPKQKKAAEEKKGQVEGDEKPAVVAEPPEDLLGSVEDQQQSDVSEGDESSADETPPPNQSETATTNFDLLGDLEAPQIVTTQTSHTTTQNTDILDLFGDSSELGAMGNRSVCKFVVMCCTEILVNRHFHSRFQSMLP